VENYQPILQAYTIYPTDTIGSIKEPTRGSAQSWVIEAEIEGGAE
jgi:hypothetical protein